MNKINGSYRVLHGGDWYDDAKSCRVTNRLDDYPLNSFDNFGFRVMRRRIDE